MKFHWFRRQQREEELDAEIRSHLDEAIRDRIARGEAPDEARANALREFGNVGLVKEVTRAMWGSCFAGTPDTRLALRPADAALLACYLPARKAARVGPAGNAAARVAKAWLGRGVFGERANVRRMESQDDLVFRNARALQFGGNVEVGIVRLNPDLLVNDLDVNDKVMDTPRLAPPDCDQGIAVGLPVKQGFIRELGIRRTPLRQFQ
jgi:hypothetical protein